MTTIVNRRGEVWYQRLDVGAALRLRDLAGVDVMRLASGDDPMPDVAGVVDCLFAILFPVLGGITPKRFGKSLRGNMTPEQLKETFQTSVVEFFKAPGPKPKPSKSNRGPTAEELWRELWRMAGAAGVDPNGYTFGELSRMSEGYSRAVCPPAAMICATVASNAFGRKGAAIKPASFDLSGALGEARGASDSHELTADNLSQFARMMMG